MKISEIDIKSKKMKDETKDITKFVTAMKKIKVGLSKTKMWDTLIA